MLCSVCKKNMAVVFINNLDKDGKTNGKVTGLCLECAKKQGIDPLSNIMNEISNMSEEQMEEMSNQFSKMLNFQNPRIYLIFLVCSISHLFRIKKKVKMMKKLKMIKKALDQKKENIERLNILILLEKI